MNVAVAGLAVPIKILNGCIPEAVMGLYSGWGEFMFKIGDCVVFALDGARGVVLGINHHSCHVIWEDYFVSWEKKDLLTVDEALTNAQRITRSPQQND